MEEAVIVTALRTPIGKAHTGVFKDTRPDDLAALIIKRVIEETPGLDPKEVDDVILGCAMPEGEQGLNPARIASVRAGLPNSVPAFTVNRFCASGLQAIAIAAERVMLGAANVVVAGGVESMSRVPMMGFHPAPNPVLVAEYPQLYMAMGYTAEELVRRYEVSREDQDAMSLRSHQRAIDAIDSGRFADEIVPVQVSAWQSDGAQSDDAASNYRIVDTDEGVRRDTSLERLSRLKPVFRLGGTITAGNSSQMSDGAAAVVIMSATKAASMGFKPRAIYRSFAVAGVDPDVMGVGPIIAVPKALALAGITQSELGLIELNEAFAGQALEVVRALDLNIDLVNVNGGAIALGHPLGCTGARQTVTIAHEAARRRTRYGLVTMCVGGGMGAAGVFEFPLS
jgi:acetyl-CoA acyltransferase